MKHVMWLLVIVGISGCAGQPVVDQRPQQPTPQQPTPLQAMVSACDLSVRPELQLLNGKVPLSLNQVQQPGLALLSADRVPTADEKAALLIYDQLHRSCVEAQVRWCAAATYGIEPEICAAQQKMLATEQDDLATLYQGEETFAQFTRAVNALHAEFQNDSTRMAQSAYDKTQQQIRASAPVQTNCQTYYDGSVRCSTQQ